MVWWREFRDKGGPGGGRAQGWEAGWRAQEQERGGVWKLLQCEADIGLVVLLWFRGAEI